MPDPHPSSLELATRLSAVAVVAEVTTLERLSPSVLEVRLAHEAAARLAGEPGNDVMIRLEDGGRSFRRRYSVRRVDAAAGTLDLWVTTGHVGPGARWANSLRPGDPVDLVGPRGKITLDPLADWYVFVGDTAALGAAYRMAESVEAPGQVVFLVELGDPLDALTPQLAADVSPTGVFVDRDGRTGDDPTGLLRALAAVELPAGDGQALVFAEHAVGRVLRTALVDRGIAEDHIAVKSFWRAGVANADNGEPPRD